MKLFLRAKHWQLFLLFFGIPFILELLLIFHVITKQGQSSLFGNVKLFPPILALYMGILFGWFWAVVTGLQKVLPATIKMDIFRFKIIFLVTLIYLISMFVFVEFFSGDMNKLFNEGSFFPVYAIIFPLHIFSIFGIFYCTYFVARTIKTAELKRSITFSDFTIEFLYTWVFIFGIWILQPRINDLINKNSSI